MIRKVSTAYGSKFIWNDWIRFLVLIVCSLSSMGAYASQPSSSGVDGATYTVDIRGVKDGFLINQLREFSKTVELQQRPTATVELLRRRVEEDQKRMKQVLNSEGYFGAEVSSQIDDATQPVLVRFQINSGSLYQLQEVNIQTIHSSTKAIDLPSPAELGFSLNQPVKTQTILNAQNSLVRTLRNKGYPFVEVSDRRVLVNHKEQSVRVRYTLSPGPRSFFGESRIRGLETLEPKYVRNRIAWSTGEWFDERLMNKTQINLIKTNLFSVVQVEHATTVDDSTHVPMILDLRERDPRTISAGAFYNSDEGPGGSIGWEHRNLFGEAESLSTELTASFIEYSGYFQYRIPDFMAVDQFLILETRLALDQPDAYDSRSQTTSAILERFLNERMTLRGGISYRLADVSQLGESESYGLVSLPFEFDWDLSDDLLDPTSGGRFKFNTEPFYDTFGNAGTFWQNHITYSHYYELFEQPDIVLAGQIGLGSIVGDSLFSIPADERFYAGGGRSVRGYPYKTISPLRNGHPIGGRSLLEMSFEARWRFAENMGLVGFIDGGSAFESSYPDFNDDLLWGVGTGFRYFTPIGPLRLDVGFPLNQRDGLDDSFELYISIGQSF